MGQRGANARFRYSDGKTYGQGTIDKAIELAGLPTESAKAEESLQRLLLGNPKETIRDILNDSVAVENLALAADQNRGSFESTLLHLKKNGATHREVDSLRSAVHAERRKNRKMRLVPPDEELELPNIVELIEGAPVPSGIVVPWGWRLSSNGVQRGVPNGVENRLGEKLCGCPILITARSKNIHGGMELVEIAWWRDSRWRHLTTERKTIASPQNIIQLANHGLPVSSLNASAMVEYLVDFEETNLDGLPLKRITNHLGWQRSGGKDGFLLGKDYISKNGRVFVTPPDGSQAPIQFVGSDSGDEQIALGFSTAGSFEEWKKVIELILAHPKIMIALYASLAPPLLTILGSPNFILDLSGPTSTGKTTTLRLAASVWGNPDERMSHSVLGTWDASRVWLERAGALLNGLPLIIDDTKRARNPKFVARTLYDVSSGRGRGRGSVKGLSASGSWNTVLISSGEAPITSFTQDGGTHARTIILWGSPFGQADRSTADQVLDVDSIVRCNYGHAGRKFVSQLLQRRSQFPRGREAFEKCLRSHLDAMSDNPVAARFASYLAALEITGKLVHRFLEIPGSPAETIMNLRRELMQGTVEADKAKEAVLFVIDWARANRVLFKNRDHAPYYNPPGGYAGACLKSDKVLGLYRHRLKGILKEQGFDTEAILRVWKDRGWLLTDSDGSRMTKRFRMNGRTETFVAIKLEAIRVVENE